MIDRPSGQRIVWRPSHIPCGFFLGSACRYRRGRHDETGVSAMNLVEVSGKTKRLVFKLILLVTVHVQAV
jgi:hypothetical protein